MKKVKSESYLAGKKENCERRLDDADKEIWNIGKSEVKKQGCWGKNESII